MPSFIVMGCGMCNIFYVGGLGHSWAAPKRLILNKFKEITPFIVSISPKSVPSTEILKEGKNFTNTNFKSFTVTLPYKIFYLFWYTVSPFQENFDFEKKSLISSNNHYMKSVCIWSFSGPYFPAFGLNTERYREFLRIQSKCGKIRTIKTPNTNIFYAARVKIIVTKWSGTGLRLGPLLKKTPSFFIFYFNF